MNSRRQILTALGASAVAGSRALFAQQPGKIWRVAFLVQRHLGFH